MQMISTSRIAKAVIDHAKVDGVLPSVIIVGRDNYVWRDFVSHEQQKCIEAVAIMHVK